MSNAPLIDVLNEDGIRTGEKLSRKEIHRLGKYHRAIHLYLFNSKNELLVQTISKTKDHYPGKLAISVAGHVDSGEGSQAAVEREVTEELGLKPESLHCTFLFSYRQEKIIGPEYNDKQFNDVYVGYADLDLATINFCKEEVSAVQYIPFDQFVTMANTENSRVAPSYALETKEVQFLVRGVRTVTPACG